MASAKTKFEILTSVSSEPEQSYLTYSGSGCIQQPFNYLNENNNYHIEKNNYHIEKNNYHNENNNNF